MGRAALTSLKGNLMKDKLANTAAMVFLVLIIASGFISVIAVAFGFVLIVLSPSIVMITGLATILGIAGISPALLVLTVIIAIAAFVLVRILGPKHIGESEQLNACQWNIPGLAWNRALSDSENLKALRKGFERHNKVVLHAYAWADFHADAKAYYSKKKVVAAAMGSQS